MKCPFKMIKEFSRNSDGGIEKEIHDFGKCDETECPFYEKDTAGKETCKSAETELKRFGK